MATTKWEAASIASLMTTELNSLANNAAALGAEYDNTSGLYLYGMFELLVTFGTNPTAASTCDLYIIAAPDGTNYTQNSTGASGAAPFTAYVGSFPLLASTSAQRLQLGGVNSPIVIPPTKFKAWLLNRSGQTMAASGNTLKMVPYRYQSA
jgi:hypothetical protein